jgi:hypothetical protein
MFTALRISWLFRSVRSGMLLNTAMHMALLAERRCY